MQNIRTEDLGHGVTVYTDADHRIGTDACLLAAFAAPRKIDTACDLGTGCGIIPLLWFSTESPPQTAYALELQPDAAELARSGVAHSGLGERLHIIEGDIRDLPDILPRGGFDLVTCNPPYKPVGAGVLSGSESGKIASWNCSSRNLIKPSVNQAEASFGSSRVSSSKQSAASLR